MRNFRTAAVAAATAATVAFGGVAVASAEDTTNDRASLGENLSSVIKDTKADEGEYPTLSSKIGANADKDQQVTGHALLGEEKDKDTLAGARSGATAPLLWASHPLSAQSSALTTTPFTPASSRSTSWTQSSAANY